MYLLSNSDLSQVSGGLSGVTAGQDYLWQLIENIRNYVYIPALTVGAVVATYSSFYRPVTTTETFLNGLYVGVTAAALGIEACRVYAHSAESN